MKKQKSGKATIERPLIIQQMMAGLEALNAHFARPRARPCSMCAPAGGGLTRGDREAARPPLGNRLAEIIETGTRQAVTIENAAVADAVRRHDEELKELSQRLDEVQREMSGIVARDRKPIL